MSVEAGKILVEVQFNPDTKQLEKVVADAEGKPIKQKLELDKGGLEGPLKDLKEFTARLSDGGLKAGFGELKAGVQTFGQLRASGGDMASSVAGGLSKVGVAGSAAITVMTAVAAATVGAVAAFLAFDKAAGETNAKFEALNVTATEYSVLLNKGVEDSTLFEVRNASLRSGLNLTAGELATVANSAAAWGRALGNVGEGNALFTSAIAGDIDAMRALNITVDSNMSRTERARVALVAIQRMNIDAEDSNLSIIDKLGKGWGHIFAKASEGWTNLTESATEHYARVVQQQDIAEARRRAAQAAREEDDRRQRAGLAVQDTFGARALSVAAEQLTIASAGMSTQDRLEASQRRSADIQDRIVSLTAITGGNEQEVADRNQQLVGLLNAQTAERQTQNQLVSFGTQLQDMQNQRLVRQAMAEGLGTRENIQQLSLGQQINEAMEYRNRLLAAAALKGRELTEEEKARLRETQRSINQNRATLAQEAAARRQREEQEFNDLMAKERQLRQEREAAVEERRRNEHSLLELAQRVVEQDRERARTLREQEASLHDIRFANLQSGIALAQTALQQQAAGIALTGSESEALANHNRLLQERQVFNASNETAIQAVRTQLETENLTLERRIELERELSTRVAQRVTFQNEERARNQQLLEQNNAFANSLIETAGGYKTMAQNATGLATGALTKLGGALSNVVAAAIEGKVSFAEAAQAALKSVLASIAQESAVQALYQTAVGLGKLAIGDGAGAGSAFASAGMFAGVAAVAGFSAAAIPEAKAKTTGASGGTAGSKTQTTNSEVDAGQPMIINLNMRPYSTAEDVENAIGSALEGYNGRRGRR